MKTDINTLWCAILKLIKIVNELIKKNVKILPVENGWFIEASFCCSNKRVLGLVAEEINISVKNTFYLV